VCDIMKCDICGKEGINTKVSKNHILSDNDILPGFGYCKQCAFKLYGSGDGCDVEVVRGLGNVDYRLDTDDGITLWIKETASGGRKIYNAWVDDGGTSVPESVYDSASGGDEIIEVIRNIRSVVHDGKRWCTSCGDILEDDEVAGTHFAGVFCDECWEDYKEGNNGMCGLCGKKRYECVC